MNSGHDSHGVYELIERISNLLRSQERERGAPLGLQPVHMQALWFISRCNRYSDTPAAVAEYLDVTRSTVSSTLKVLRDRGLVVERRDPDDGRVSRLSLSDEGRRLEARELPPQVLRDAIADLAPRERDDVESTLAALLRGVQLRAGARAFGVCHTCRHFVREDTGYRCGLTLETLRPDETDLLCRDHGVP